MTERSRVIDSYQVANGTIKDGKQKMQNADNLGNECLNPKIPLNLREERSCDEYCPKHQTQTN